MTSDRYTSVFAKSFPLATHPEAHWTEKVVTQGHADYCAKWGHATYKIDDISQGFCPRCGHVFGSEEGGSAEGSDDQGQVDDDEAGEKTSGPCEDFPCCGHERGDCNGEKYGSDESIKAQVERAFYDEDYAYRMQLQAEYEDAWGY